MLTLHGFSYWAVLGAADLETRYATILVVLATAVMMMIYYAFFTTISHRYRLIPHCSSLFPTRKPPQTPHRTPEPLPEKDAAVDVYVFPCTRSEDLALAGEPDSTPGFEVVANPIVELAESAARDVVGGVPPSQPFSGLEAHHGAETNVSGPEGRDAEQSSQPESLHVDGVVADLPLVAHPEVELGAGSPDAEGKPQFVEIQEMVCATSGHASGDSDDAQPRIESAESLVTVSISSPLAPTLEPADVEVSLLMETPFLLSVDNGSPEDDEASLGSERLTEDNPDATSPSATVALAGSAFVECPCSRPDSLHEDVSSDIMNSALLVPAKRVVDEGESSEAAGGLEIDDDDDWTSVDPDEPSTPRPSSPAGPQSEMAESTSTTWSGENDLAVSAVLLTQSQYAPVILTLNTINDSNLSSLTSSLSPRSVHPRVHTEARPDWAVAPREEQEDIDATRERTQRRHSVDSPDWAVAPEDTGGGARMKGRKSDPGSGRRKKPRRAWASR